jgi:hypothetical protein
MHERDYQGNYKISNQEKICISSCVLLFGIILYADLYMLYKVIF